MSDLSSHSDAYEEYYRPLTFASSSRSMTPIPTLRSREVSTLLRTKDNSGYDLGPETIYPQTVRGFPHSSAQVPEKYTNMTAEEPELWNQKSK
jgi:hypothetical protein